MTKQTTSRTTTAKTHKAKAVAKAKPTPKPKATPERPKQDPTEESKPVGVRHGRTRPYLAGVVIREAGLEAGVTPALIAELDKRYGVANARESIFALKNAWHAVRGFMSDDA